MPDAGVLATILLIVGLFLLALELMIPSFGMIGIMSAVTLLVSAWCAWQAWWATSPGFFWTYAGFWVLGIPSVLGGMLFLLQNTSLGDRIVLRGPSKEEVTPSSPGGARLDSLVGQIGKAASLLTPGGMVVVNGERYHAESPGMMIESGSPVEVISVKGNRLVVKMASDAAISQAKQTTSKVTKTVEKAQSPVSDPLGDTVMTTDHRESVAAKTSTEGEQGDTLDFEIPED